MTQCAECTYLDLSDGNYDGKFWCERKCERHLATDPECYSFCRAYSRDYSTIRNAIEFSNKHSGGCFLTTMLCNILKMPDNNYYLQTMRGFRNNILQKNEQYKEILVSYDIIGPKIANALNNDPLRDKIAKIHFDKYIVEIVKLITYKKYDEAVNLYIEMTNNLKKFYGIINDEITIEIVNNADIEKSGHGKYIVKKSLG